MAGKADKQLAAAKAARDAARAEALLRGRKLIAEFTLDRLGERAVRQVRHHAVQAAGRAVDLASDNRGIVAAGLSLLGAWLIRQPIVWRGIDFVRQRR